MRQLSALMFAFTASLLQPGEATNLEQKTAGLDIRVRSEIKQAIRAAMGADNIPGLAVGVYQNGQPVLLKGFGLADLENDVAVTPDTVFQLGSVGKQFTAAAVLLLVQDGRLQLDEPIRRYLTALPESWNAVTIRHLLSHMGGVPDPDRFINFRLDYSASELIQILGSKPLDFEPGTQWSYSNGGYELLGFLIEKISGMKYGQFVQQRIFTPLKMSSSRPIDDIALVKRRAHGYEMRDKNLVNQHYVSATFNSTADGSLYSTVRDLTKWDAALYTDALLNKNLRNEMWQVAKLRDGSPSPFSYGYGWMVDDINGVKVVQHSGGWQGFSAHIVRFPERGLSVAVLTNVAGPRPPADLARSIATLVDPELRLHPMESAPGQKAETCARNALLQALSGSPQQRRAAFSTRGQSSWTLLRIEALEKMLRGPGAWNLSLRGQWLESGQIVSRFGLMKKDREMLRANVVCSAGQLDSLDIS